MTVASNLLGTVNILLHGPNGSSLTFVGSLSLLGENERGKQFLLKKKSLAPFSYPIFRVHENGSSTICVDDSEAEEIIFSEEQILNKDCDCAILVRLPGEERQKISIW